MAPERWKNRGNFMTIEERFWSKVIKGSAGDCWHWTGAKLPKGYGKFSVGPRATRKIINAHRIAWELTNGPIPEGIWVLHDCDNPSCCNPMHLYLGTNTDNVRDKVSKGRQAIDMSRDTDGRFISKHS